MWISPKSGKSVLRNYQNESQIAFRGPLIWTLVWVSIDFQINSKQDASFHCIAYGYSYADWIDLHNHLRDAPWEDVFKLCASTAASEFCEWVWVGIDVFISHCMYACITSNLTHRHGFQQLVYSLDPLFFKGGGREVNFDYLSRRGGGIWKFKKRGWKYGAGAGPLKRGGLTLFLLNFFEVYHFYI